MDRFAALRTFIAVVDHAGFAAAARALDLAPPVVTRRVAELEAQLGVRLLTRTTRRLALTTLGHQYLDRIRPVLAALDEADRLVAAAAQEVSGRVRINAPADLLREVLVPEIAALRLLHPRLQAELVAEEGRLQPCESADLTLIVNHATNLDGDFVARPLAQTTAMVCASPRYLSGRGPITHPRDLDGHPMLLPSLNATRRDFRFMPMGGLDTKPHLLRPGPTPLSSTSSDTMMAAALAGQGLVGTLSFVVRDALESGRLVRVLPDWQIEVWRIVAVYQHRASLTTAARTLLEHLQQRLGDGRIDPWLRNASA